MVQTLHSSCSSWTRSLTGPLCPTTGALGFKEQKTVEVPQLQCLVDVCWRSSSTVVDVPVLMQRRCFACSSRTRSLTCPLLSRQGMGVQFLDKVVFMPVACRQCWGPDVQKTVSTVAFLDKVADVLVVSARRCRRYSSCGCSDGVVLCQQ